MSESTTAEEIRRKRPWIAVVLAVVVPGLGHLYIKMWGRSLLWFTLYFLSVQFLVPDEAIPDSTSFTALSEAVDAMPTEVMVLVLAISILNVVDAYMMTSHLNRKWSRDSGSSCPNCGKEVDEDLDFCHWCTAKLK